MFNKKTVFILGAGASWHYNYPTGADLVKCIIEKATELADRLASNSIHIKWRNNLTEYFDEKFSEYYQEGQDGVDYLRNFIDRINHVDPPVIDYFLDWNSDWQEIGQMMISWVILDREREFEENKRNGNHQRLVDQNPNPKNRYLVDAKQCDDNWYRFILYKMLSDCLLYQDFIQENHVHFITFNYDVSLETYLYRGLKQIQFMKSGDMQADQIKECLVDKFTHMYGSLKNNPYQGAVSVIKDTRNFHDNFKDYVDTLDEIYQASRGIRTIGSFKKNDNVIQFAQKKIEEAEDVYILGYGFDESNNKRLGLKDLLSLGGLNQGKQPGDVGVKKNVYFTNFCDHNSVNKKAGKALVNDTARFLQDKSKIYVPESHYPHVVHTYYEKSIKNVYDALEQDFDFI
ncbi:MAG: hypothetical protein ACRBDL_02115 [Alphaproteobacteria bacterium]